MPLAGYRLGAGGDLADLSGRWATAYGTGPDGASLVRPDGHVAWGAGHRRTTGRRAPPRR